MILGISLIVFQAMNPILASAAVPGLGELIQGEKSKARTFFILEGSIWLSYLGFNYFGHKMDKSAKAFAVDHTGANPANHDDRYFDAIEDYLSSEQFNLDCDHK
jgi:arginine exporter protein ArgO